MRITSIELKKLFGELDHNIQLHRDGITFIHGPNGSGKSTVLRLIAGLFGGDIDVIRRTIFSELVIHFSDDTSLFVAQTPYVRPPDEAPKAISPRRMRSAI